MDSTVKTDLFYLGMTSRTVEQNTLQPFDVAAAPGRMIGGCCPGFLGTECFDMQVSNFRRCISQL
jgi:hypothetical protein